MFKAKKRKKMFFWKESKVIQGSNAANLDQGSSVAHRHAPPMISGVDGDLNERRWMEMVIEVIEILESPERPGHKYFQHS